MAELNPDELRFLDRVTAEPSATRAQARRQAAGVLLIGLLASLASFVAVGGFRDGGLPRDPALIATTTAGTAIIAAAAVHLAFGTSPLASTRRSLRLLVILVPLAIFSWKVGWSVLFDADAWNAQRPGLKCLGVSHLVGLPAVLAFVLARRGSDPVHPALTAAGLGTAAGAWSALLVDLWCPVGHPVHVLLGHILPIATLTGLAWWAGRRRIAIGG